MKKKIPAKKAMPKGKDLSAKKETPDLHFLIFSFITVLALSFVFYFPILQNGFSNWDDPTYIENNPLIKEFTAENFKRIFTEIYFSNYQPLHIASYFFEYRLFGDDPFGYHLVSLFMHGCVTGMVIWFVFLLSGNRMISFLTGILFAVHPMHVESVAWAAERKDLLYALFTFAALVAYLYYLKDTGSLKYYYACLFFFTLAIFSKAMAACVPPVLILVDIYYRRKINARVIVEKIPFFLLAVILGMISVYASGRDGSINDNSTFTFIDRMVLACSNLVMYMVKLLVPFKLSAFYPYPMKTGDLLPVYYYAAPVIVLLVAASVIYSLKFTRIIFFGTGFIFLTLLLVLQLLPVGPTVFSERYSYIPSATLFMMMAYGFHYLLKKYQSQPTIRTGMIASFAIYSIWLGVITYNRSQVWKTPDTLWSDVISQFENVPIAYNNRGHYYNKTGKKEKALADFNKAISQNPVYDMALFNRGSLYGEMNRLDESLNDLDLAIKSNPKLPEAYKMRGQVYAMSGKSDLAMADFKKALELQPDYAEIYFNMGIFHFNAGNRDEACKNFRKADQLRFAKARDMTEKYCQ